MTACTQWTVERLAAAIDAEVRRLQVTLDLIDHTAARLAAAIRLEGDRK